MIRRALVVAFASGAASSCATLAQGHAGLDNPPSSREGPFRLLIAGEIGAEHPAPYAIDDGRNFLRDPSVVRGDGGPLSVTGYFAGVDDGKASSDPTTRIVRFDALDGRTFPQAGVVVLTAGETWEGGTIGAPSALHETSGDTLYYEGAGGIGRALPSGDGTTFASASAPVMSAAMVPWGEGQTPKSPAVVRLKDSSYRMFFEVDLHDGAAIGEAKSTDAEAWTLVGEGPALVHGAAGSVDELGAATPSAVLATSEEGREILDVYYTAMSANGPSIALAARFLDTANDAPLVRSPSAMLAAVKSLAVRKPSVVRLDSFTLLFATENVSKTSTDPGVIVAVTPATVMLPPATQ